MRKFIADYPILSMLLASCLGTIIFVITGFVLLIVGSIKLSKSIAASSNTTFTKTTDKYTYHFGNKDSKNKFLSIPVNGIIYTEQEGVNPLQGLTGNETYGYTIKKLLTDAAKDNSIKGVILEIDSPGGTISGANAILEGVEQYKQVTQKPIYTHVMGLAASGGYMAAIATNKIFAEPGSLIGSIGVIIGPFKYYDKVLSEGNILNSVTTQNGIESFNITAGTDKDFGDPYKKLSEKARATLQQGVDNEYKSFVDKVSTLRGIDKSTITNTLGALIFDNQTAENYKLIDGTLSRDNAYVALAETQKLSANDFQIVTLKQNNFWKEVFSVSGLLQNVKPATTCALCGQPLFLYGEPR